MRYWQGLLLLAAIGAVAFNPREYEKQVAKFPAVNRAENREVEIDIHYVDIHPPAAKKTLLMVHGWPGLWSTWSYQIDAFKDEYRIIAVDQRGFGASTHPDDVSASGNMVDMAGDLACVLGHAKADPAICIGHDWGSAVCYEAARARPDLYAGVVGIVVPYLPASGAFVPTAALAAMIDSFSYQVYFSTEPARAAAELDRDVRRTLRSTLRTLASGTPAGFLKSTMEFLGAWGEGEIEPVLFMTREEEDYMVEQYSIQGFKNTIQFYQHDNRLATWRFASEQGNHTLAQPVLAIYPTRDKVADWHAVAEQLGTHSWLPRVTVQSVEASHWPHMEQPEVVNDALRTWLASFESEPVHERDEL